MYLKKFTVEKEALKHPLTTKLDMDGYHGLQ